MRSTFLRRHVTLLQEFIEQAEEIYSFNLDERENFIGYIANRPGVKKAQ